MCGFIYPSCISPLYGPVAGKHSNRRSLPYAFSMAYLGSTTGRHRHGVGRGGGGGTGGDKRGGRGGRRPTGPGTDKERRGARRASWGKGGGGGKKKNRWWGALKRRKVPTEEEVPIKCGTYNIRNRRGAGSTAKGGGAGEHRHGVYAGYQYYRRSLHPRGGRVPRRRYGRTEPTPRRDRHVLQGGSGVCGGGGATVRADRAERRGSEWRMT